MYVGGICVHVCISLLINLNFRLWGSFVWTFTLAQPRKHWVVNDPRFLGRGLKKYRGHRKTFSEGDKASLWRLEKNVDFWPFGGSEMWVRWRPFPAVFCVFPVNKALEMNGSTKRFFFFHLTRSLLRIEDVEINILNRWCSQGRSEQIILVFFSRQFCKTECVKDRSLGWHNTWSLCLLKHYMCVCILLIWCSTYVTAWLCNVTSILVFRFILSIYCCYMYSMAIMKDNKVII